MPPPSQAASTTNVAALMIPIAGGAPAVLMESSGYVLMEDGSHILLE